MRVSISECDIECGKPGSSTRCPLALVLRRETGRKWEVITVLAWDGAVRLAIPPVLQRWMRRFDAGKKVQPVTVDLEEERE